MGADPVDAVADRLYALPPEEFVAARDEAAAQAKKAGDRELAARIAKLRRPTVGAWLVNLLAHECPDLIAQLLQLGEQLRGAQRNLRGDELRELSQQRRELVTALASRAAALGRRRMRGNLPLAEVQATLTAALAEPEVAEQVRTGRLTKTVSYAGFGEPPRPQLRVLPGGRADAPADDGGRAADRGDPQGDRAAAKADRQAAVQARRRAADDGERRAAEDAERRAAEAERRAEEAERRAAEIERRAEEREAARAVQEQRRRERAAAHRELLAARTELAEAEAARTTAERAVTAAKRRVEKAARAATQLDAAED